MKRCIRDFTPADFGDRFLDGHARAPRLAQDIGRHRGAPTAPADDDDRLVIGHLIEALP